jgi:DNA polymerase
LYTTYRDHPAWREYIRTGMNFVPGDGPLTASVLLVGEAPGKDEDRLGKPFVGASGRVLDGLLAVAGLAREDVRITNMMKFRPPKNRDPLEGERIASSLTLWTEIAIQRPRVVVALGRHALHVLAPGITSITAVAGRPLDRYRDKHGFVLLPMLHPAVALHAKAMHETLEEHWRANAELLRC